jgi:hypothetical protein
MQDQDTQRRGFYRCWAGTKHYAFRIPGGADAMTPLQFSCGCIGSVRQNPAVIRELERMPDMTLQDALIIAQLNPPPTSPVVAVGELEWEEA